MQSTQVLRCVCLAGLGLAAVAACSNNNGTMSVPANSFTVTNLVSDTNTAAAASHNDANLVNAWGLVFNPTGFAWIANNGTNSSTLYDGNGVAQSLVVSMPKAGNGNDNNPTGIVFNSTTDFMVPGPNAPAAFVFDGEGGTIAAWAGGNSAVNMADNSATGAVYKSLALASSGGNNFLYAADFHNNKVDVFDKNFAAAMPGSFVDPHLPAGYAPFGMAAIGSQIYIGYAQQKAPDNHDEADGAGLGLVDVFNTDGSFVKTLVAQAAGNHLNAPWGIAMAPAGFGPFSGALLVANFGDGAINAFDPTTGQFIDSLRNPSGQPILIPGIWGIAFGNGINNQPANTLFIAAGIHDEADGLFARIDPPGASSMTQTCTGYGC